MSQLVRLEGKHTYQNAHCALLQAGQFSDFTVTSSVALTDPAVNHHKSLTTLRIPPAAPST